VNVREHVQLIILGLRQIVQQSREILRVYNIYIYILVIGSGLYWDNFLNLPELRQLSSVQNPLSFHYSGWLIGIPRMDYDNPQYIYIY
jgi:hypothetical protein